MEIIARQKRFSLKNEKYSYCKGTILIEGHTRSIPAHKYVLATGSSVFYAMFYGGLAENKKDIEVPDVEPAAFLALLK